MCQKVLQGVHWLTHETFAHHRGVYDQCVVTALRYWATSGVVYNASIMAKNQKSNLREGYLSRRLRNMAAQQPMQITVRCSVVAPACTTLLALLRAGVYFLV